jgi:hypothetical protein
VKLIRSVSDIDPSQKSLLLGLRLLNIVGDKVLESTIKGLGPRIRSSLPIGLTTLTQLQDLDFKTSAGPLIAVCYALAQGSVVLDQSALGKKVDDIGGQPFDNAVKVLLLASELLKTFGDGLVDRALLLVVPASMPRLPQPAPSAVQTKDEAA